MAIMAMTTYDNSALDTDTHRLDDLIAARNDLLREHNISREIIHEAWFIMAHLIMDDGARIVHMGCQTGEITFAMAALYPHLHFTGLDIDKRKITKANAMFELDNLDYKIGDPTSGLFDDDSLDGIIDSHFLHVVYSESGYNEAAINDTLKAHHRMLKTGGQLFLRDFARPPPEEFVLIEMPDEDSLSDELEDLSDADLLVWYSENARPSLDPGCGGFFLEELPPKFPKTRLFRLPHKWAYEFIMRKDNRAEWEHDLPTEYTFFTAREMRRALRQMGMRVTYASPYWDEDIIRETFEGQFRLYTDDGVPMDYPPLSYIAISTKMDERQSMEVFERRPSQTKESSITIQTVSNENNGTLVDIARRDLAISEIMPYRVADNGKLKIYLHSGLVRALVNAVPRMGSNLGEQRWSGHMIETIAVDATSLPDDELLDAKSSQKFAQKQLGLKTAGGATLEKGPLQYPAPDYLDECIQCYFLNVLPNSGIIAPLQYFLSSYKYTAKGEIKEFDAQQVLDAIGVGVIPNARLELQILALYEHLRIKPENWSQKDVQFQISEVITNTSLAEMFGPYRDHTNKFRDSKKSAEQLRCIHSIFVEEGPNNGSITGISHEDVDFVVHNEQTANIAVVLPLTRNIKKEINAGFLMEQMPVAQRHEGNGLTVSAPRFPLPPEITNLRLAKKYLADKFSVLPDNVIKLGEPYFTHPGMTPQKIFPFAIVLPTPPNDPAIAQFLPFYQLMLLRRSLSKDTHFMLLMGRAYRYLNDELKMDAKVKSKYMMQRSFDYQTPGFSIPLDYHRAPSLPDAKPADAPHMDAVAKAKLPPADVPAPKQVALQENEPPKFAASERSAASKASDTVKALVAPLLKKPDPKTTPRLAQDFDRELDRFFKDMDAFDNAAKPSPEKW